jgi:hypothetical protein
MTPFPASCLQDNFAFLLDSFSFMLGMIDIEEGVK